MSDIPILTLWLAGGTLIGLAYFRMVRQSADLMLSARRGGPWLAIAFAGLRMAGLAAALVLAAIQGGGPLLAATLGLLIGRMAMMRAARGGA